jgi:phospholipase/lecithinase/hemolysin
MPSGLNKEVVMQVIRRWAGALVLAAAVLVSANAGAAAITNLVVFGDSLSDPGNAAALTPTGGPLAFFPASPSGRFSNGPTAAEYMAQSLGITVTKGWPAAAGANNMAIGGALTGNGNYNFLIDDPAGLATNPAYATVGSTGVAQQIAAYKLANPAGLGAPGTMSMLWAGPNDFFLSFAQFRAGIAVDFTAVVIAAVTNMANNIGALALQLGARDIFVPNMPDLGLTPAAAQLNALIPGFKALATNLSDAYNFELAKVIATAATSLGPLGVDMYSYDTAGYLRAVIAKPADFGFTNVTDACIPAGLASNCAGYLFWDGVHPTTQAHWLLAGEFVSAIPEPSTYALLAIGLFAMLLVARRRRA